MEIGEKGKYRDLTGTIRNATRCQWCVVSMDGQCERVASICFVAQDRTRDERIFYICKLCYNDWEDKVRYQGRYRAFDIIGNEIP